MKTFLLSPRADFPHPLVTVAGLLVFAIGVAVRGLLSPPLQIASLAGFLIVFRIVTRWSARRMRERRLRMLENLKQEPILRLND